MSPVTGTSPPKRGKKRGLGSPGNNSRPGGAAPATNRRPTKKKATTPVATSSSSSNTSPRGGTKSKASPIVPSSSSTTTTTTLGNGTVPITPTFPSNRTLIVDNGGDTIKYGWMSDDGPAILPNISARLNHQFTTLVGDELSRVQNPSSLLGRTRSMERGVLCNLENQTRVWKRMLDLLGITPIPTNNGEAAQCLGWKKVPTGGGGGPTATTSAKKGGNKTATMAGTGSSPSSVTTTTPIPAHAVAVILLLPPHCPRVVLDQVFQIWMEDFGVSYLGLGISTVCASHDQIVATPWKTSCTVDVGWSSTLIVPTFRLGGLVRPDTIRRIPLGGRHMVNMLKYYMSYRQYNLMDQEVLLRDVFERLSYLSLNFSHDMRVARLKASGRRPYDRDFVLPDYQRTFQGEIRIPQALQRDIEREEKRKNDQKLQGENGEDDDDDDDEEDEDYEGEEEGGDDDDDDQLEDDYEEDPAIEVTKKQQQRREKRGTKRRRKDQADNKEDEDEIDEEDDDDEEESMEALRERLLRERAEEERRRRQREQEEQVLRVSVERFAVPEVLFRPQDAGIQADLIGLPEAIVQSVQSCPEPYRAALYRTVYLVGGLSRMPNIRERLESELRSLVPAEYEMKITVAESPTDRAWFGAKVIFQQHPHTKWSVSRKEWEDVSKRKAYSKLLIENGGCYT